MPATYEEFQQQPASEKIGLVIMEAARRLIGWEVFSGSVYRISLSNTVIVSIEESGTELSAASDTSLSVGKYYYDRATSYLYLRTTDSASPDSKFIALTFQYFFSNVPVAAPHDLGTGFEVEWIPVLDGNANFIIAIESTKNLLGVAISNSSSIKLKNDQSFWAPIYDKVTLESHRVFIYSWTRSLPITEAKLIYKGTIAARHYSATEVTFDLTDFLDELRSPVSAPLLSDYSGTIRIPDSLLNTYQRVIYGYVKGHVPTPIDQTLSTGYPLTGTLSASFGSNAVVGAGTSFLRELTPGDEVYIGAGAKVSIESVTDDTNAVLSSVYPFDSEAAADATVITSAPRRWQNRRFLIAGHELSRPFTTVSAVVDASSFFVADSSFFQEGDTVQSGSYQAVVRVLGDGFVKLVQAFGTSPTVGSTLYLPSVSNVYVGQDLLTFTDDFTYNEATALLALTDTAERNAASDRKMSGTIAISIGSRNIVGTGTQFRTQLAACDWIRLSINSDYLEILQIVDDTNLIVRTVPDADDDGSGVAVFKRPVVYGRSSVLSCDVLGKSDEDGNLIRFAGGIAKDLLTDAGLAAYLNTDSFDEIDDLLPHRIGFAVPSTYNAKSLPSLRDALNLVCRSTFCSVVLSNDFELKMSVLEPSCPEILIELSEPDVLNLSIASDSSQIVRRANVTYGFKEYDAASSSQLTRTSTYSNDRFLSSTNKEFTLQTCLLDEEDAEIFASRWAFLLDAAPADIKILTAMQGSRLQVNDIVSLVHEKLYERFGSDQKTRIAAVLSVTKTISGVELILNDFGNAFARCARITEDSAADFSGAEQSEILVNGYQTDENGLTDDDTSGVNLIW